MAITAEVDQLTKAYRTIGSERTRLALLQVTRSIAGDRPPAPMTAPPPRPEASAEEIDVYVGTRIRGRREALGMSRGRLGRMLGLTYAQIGHFEKGSNRIGAGRLVQIAKALGTNACFFFGDFCDAPHHPPSPAATGDEARLLMQAFEAIALPEDRLALIAVAREIGPADNG